MIHQKHPDHGFTIAYTQAEAKINEKNGWKKCDIKKEFADARKAKAKAAKEALAAMDEILSDELKADAKVHGVNHGQ